MIVTLPELIGDVGIFIDGDWVESKDQDSDGDVRLIQLADIGVGKYLNKSSRFMTSDKARFLKCTYLKRNDILIARMPEPIGRACIFPGDSRQCVTVVDVCILRVYSNIANINWLAHQINSTDFQKKILGWVSGTTRKRISRSNLSRLKISLPSLKEQKRIAAILDKADAIRRKRQQAIKLSKQLLQSVFLDMFGDPVSNPKGYKVGKIGDLLSSVNYGTSSKAGEKGEFPILRMNNITYEGDWNLDSLKYISMDKKERKKYTAEPGDILFNRTNSKDLVGKTAVFRETKPYIFAGYLIRSKTNFLAEPKSLATLWS